MKSDTEQSSPNWPIDRRDQAKKIGWENGREGARRSRHGWGSYNQPTSSVVLLDDAR
ncbi:hypothetical protein GCM10010253_25690 [Streptomyces badius]|uniref:Uncharacterized protein n=1 Tax=Streptomyces badius TaxID=1941 RepID=A0ABQ2T390_STRBA|nr:hypothetical protein GCM10010253_25690 [Streptomyces badius]